MAMKKGHQQAGGPFLICGCRLTAQEQEVGVNGASRLDELRADFLSNTTLSMPIAGMIFWGVVALASLRLAPHSVAFLVLFGSGMVLPLGGVD